MLSSVGAFVQNTLKPLIEELDVLLGKCKYINLTKSEIKELMETLINFEETKMYVYGITYLILGVLFCLTVYFILR